MTQAAASPGSPSSPDFAAAMKSTPVAAYWDFENLHARLVEDRQGDGAYNTPDGRFKAQEPLVQVQKLADFVATLGPISVHRAYCNWQYFGRYREALLGASMDLVQLFPPGGSAKNGADIRLCLDALDDCARFASIEQFVIIGGDSDFMPLAHKLKAAGRRVMGIGARKSTNRYWAGCCDAFYYYEDLVAA